MNGDNFLARVHYNALNQKPARLIGNDLRPDYLEQARIIIARYLYRHHDRYEVSPLTLKEVLGAGLSAFERH